MIDREPAIEKVLVALKEGQPEYSACGTAGISYSAWYDWKKDTPGLQERVNSARASRIPICEDAIYKAAMKGDWRAAVVYLEKHDKGWRERLKDSAGPTVVLDGSAAVMLGMMSPEQRQKLIGALHVSGLLPSNIIEMKPSENGHSNGNGSNGSDH